MYVLISKEKCIQCYVLKDLLDEKGFQYHYLDMLEMPHKTMTYLRMYCNSHPVVFSVNCFSTFNDTLEHFRSFETYLKYFYISPISYIPQSSYNKSKI